MITKITQPTKPIFKIPKTWLRHDASPKVTPPPIESFSSQNREVFRSVQFEVQRGLPVQLLVKYFAQTNEFWQIDASIRAMVQFRTHNLLGNIVSLGAFDVVFCRNVLIYFDPDTKRRVLEQLGRVMPPDGFLFLGGAETVLGVSESFQPVKGFRGIYELTQQTSH